MILVDTSVLIDYFKGNKNEKTELLERIIADKIPFGINKFIYQELLQGARDNREFELLKAYLSTQKFYDLKDSKSSYENAARIYLNCKKKGITIRSTIDTIIGQCAIENKVKLLHNDKDFTLMATVIKELIEY